MFFHNLKYALKALYKNKALIFWTFAFPIILGTLFKLAFQDIESNEKLSIIEIGIVTNETWNQQTLCQETFLELSNSEKNNQLFEIEYGTEQELAQSLENDEISGYLLFEETPKIIVKNSGINETIFKQVTEEIAETTTLYETIIQTEIQKQTNIEDFGEMINRITSKIEEIQKNPINIKDNSSKNMSYTMIEYYTLIAMTCLYGGILGMVAINKNLANMSAVGKRISISSSKKGTLLASSILASFLIQLLGLALLFLYTIVVLKVDYGSKTFYIILLAIIGSLAGLSLGVATACLCKGSENTKTGIILAITMTGCFLSGMMGITMKYVIDTHIPLLNQLNPANKITDGLYSLYYYDTMNRYTMNCISLLIFSGILLILSTIVLRRQKYDSI